MGGERRLGSDLIEDSKATLRQVDGVLSDLSGDASGGEGGTTDSAVLLEVLLKAYTELATVVDSLRRSRGALHQATVARIQTTHAKLAEVSSTTESAASAMLDGLDRCVALVDRLDEACGTDSAGSARRELRAELDGLVGRLQFQDITSQQLGYAGSVLKEVEDRLEAVKDVLAVGGQTLRELGHEDPSAFEEPCSRADSAPGSDGVTVHDPAATVDESEGRQALADSIFG